MLLDQLDDSAVVLLDQLDDSAVVLPDGPRRTYGLGGPDPTASTP